MPPRRNWHLEGLREGRPAQPSLFEQRPTPPARRATGRDVDETGLCGVVPSSELPHVDLGFFLREPLEDWGD